MFFIGKFSKAKIVKLVKPLTKSKFLIKKRTKLVSQVKFFSFGRSKSFKIGKKGRNKEDGGKPPFLNDPTNQPEEKPPDKTKPETNKKRPKLEKPCNKGSKSNNDMETSQDSSSSDESSINSEPAILFSKRKQATKDLTSKVNQENNQNEQVQKFNKYNQNDKGPFVVFARKENAKEITLARDLKNAGITNIQNIFKINDNLLKIIFKESSNANKAIDFQSILKHELFIPDMYTTTYGIVKGIETDIHIDEIKQNIRSEVAITSVERIMSYDRTKKVQFESTIIKIGFRASYLPRKVVLFEGILKDVTFYLPRPMYCTDCVNYGHTKKKCKSNIKRCNTCGDTLQKDSEHSCKGVNCRFCVKNHATNSKECDERNVQIKIRNTMTIKKTSYREAKKIVAARLNIAIDNSITNFPNLSLNTSRINNINKFNDTIKEITHKYDNLITLIDQIKQKLSNTKPNHPGNDFILIEIGQLLEQQKGNQTYSSQLN